MIARTLRLQKRDTELVRTVFLHRVARRDDILGLGFFGSVARCNQRLSELVRSDWLRRVEGTNGLLGQQSIYAAGRAASSYLRRALDLPESEVARHCSKGEGPLLIEHALRAIELRVMLHQQSSANGYLLSDWLTEPECLHEFQVASGQNGPWETLAIKPDGYFRLWQDGERHDFFLEVDLGNVSLPRFEQKLIRYRKYAGCGAFTEAYGSARFVVLTVTLGERRLSHLADLAGRGFAHLITTFPRIEAAGVFGCMCNTNAASSVSLATAIRMAA